MTAEQARALMASLDKTIERIDKDIEASARINCAWTGVNVDNQLKDQIIKHYEDKGFTVEQTSFTTSFSSIKIRW